MPAILSTIILPAVTKGPGVFSRLLSAACEGIAGYLGRRTAIACLHDLDDRALRDIGLARSQIEPAVYGLITLFRPSGRRDDDFRGRDAPTWAPARATVEVAPWS